MNEKPIKVAIVGGGCAGVSTAFELTRPEHNGKYQVTVYQSGWRLGGKGASGRGACGRIEEHGLHLWMGFYENAFRLMRECYSELDRDPEKYDIADWRDAFSRDPFVGVADVCADGEWRPWTALFPAGNGEPGDPLDEQNPFTLNSYLWRTVALLRALFGTLDSRLAKSVNDKTASDDDAQQSGQSLVDSIATLLGVGQLATMASVYTALQLLVSALEQMPLVPSSLLERLLKTIRDSAYGQIEQLIATDDDARRLWELADVILACLQGTVRFGLMTDPRGFDSIDDYDWREWLVLNGASESSVDSAFMRGIYDLLFAYEDGDINKPRMSAGQAIRGAVRMFFSYRGALFWKMNAGMGDIVFAPFYEVLKRRGVSFEFFHHLDKAHLVDEAKLSPGEKPYIESLEFSVQAHILNNAEYVPLVDIKGLPSWPAAPDYDQLEQGRTIERENWNFESDWDKRKASEKNLHVTEDFDFVVLAVGLGAVPKICADIIARDARWQDMVERVATVETQAFQLWMNRDMSELGWHAPPINLSGFVTPFDTWADMGHLAECEDWPTAPASIAYFCSVLPRADIDDSDYQQQRYDEVRRNALRYMHEDLVHLWPDALREDGEFRWELLMDANNPGVEGAPSSSTAMQFDTQFWKANVNATDRYTLSLPGTSKYRISPLDNSYDNLTIAGDWTDCSHNAGCVEAAVMSGRLAAHALSGYPRLEDIVGYDHP
ncbi:MAG: FAD-dependent oxidoreductase [Pseudomonadota bacterium]